MIPSPVLMLLPSLWLLPVAGATPPAPTAIEAADTDAERLALEAERDALREEMRALREEIRSLREEPEPPLPADAVRGERVAFGQPVVVAEGEQVEEVVSFGDDVRISGRVLGDAVSFGGNVVIGTTGRVEGDAVSFGGRVEIEDGGRVEGDRVAMGVPGVALTVRADAEPSAVGSVALATDAGALLHQLYRRLVLMLSVAGAGVLVVGLFPQRVGRVAEDLEARPLRAAVVGTLASGFLALFGLLFTLLTFGLGLPITLLLYGLLGLAWLLGFVGLCQAVGDRLPFEQRPHGRWVAFLVGVVLLTFAGSLPWVGWLVVGAASLLGIGAALSTRFGRA